MTGIEIFKLLAKTNCGDCGVPTCLAFAMNLAAGKAELSACPHVSDEAKSQLEESSAPPIRTVAIGTGDAESKAGGETVLFRHEKTFCNPTVLGVLVSDTMEDAEIDAKLDSLGALQYDRIGLNLKADVAALKNESGDTGKFEALVKKAVDKGGFGLILMSDSTEALSAGAGACADKKPLLYAATEANADDIAKIAVEKKCSVCAKADDIEGLIQVTTKLDAAGIKDIVLDSGSRQMRKALEDQIAIRRAALLQKVRELGYPTITFPCEMTDDRMKEPLIASAFIAKYGGIVILSELTGETLFPLLLQRLNIYTDPQRPMATEQGVYEIGNPDENSPVLVTTNFSLTYFIVSGEIETSRVPTWLVVMDSEGLSVMTAWAAGKFVGDAIGIFIKKSGIADKIKHRKIIIPGYAAIISGDLEEELGSEWEVLAGPREASHIPAYLKQNS